MRLTIQTKLMAGFAVVLALMGLASWVSIGSMAALRATATSIYQDNLLPTADQGDAMEKLYRVRGDVLEYLLAPSPDDMTRVQAQMAEDEKNLLADIDKIGKYDITPEEKAQLAKFNTAWPAFKAERDNVLRLRQEGKTPEALALFEGTLKDKYKPLDESTDAMGNILEANAQRDNEQGTATYERTQKLVLGVLLAAVLAGLAQSAQAIAAGDLTQRLVISSRQLQVRSNDELGDMARTFNEMIRRLQETGDAFEQMTATLRAMVGEILSNAAQLATASQQLSAASDQAGSATNQIATTIQQVARGNQEQSAAVQETSASIEQLSRAIDQIAGGAQDQARSMDKTAESVGQLNSSIARVTAASKELAAAGEQVGTAATSHAYPPVKEVEGKQAMGRF